MKLIIRNSNWKIAFFVMIFISSYFFFKYSANFYFSENQSLSPIIFDAITYFKMSLSINQGDANISEYFELHRNNVGQILILQILQNNIYLFFLFNSVSLYIAINQFFKSINYPNTKFFYFFINPLLMINLISMNKEILAFIAILFLSTYIISKNKKILLVSLIYSFLSRIDLLFLFVIFLILKKFNDSSKKTLIYVLLLTLTFFLGIYSNFIGNSIVEKVLSQKDFSISKIFYFLVNNYLFFLILIPKIIVNLFGDMQYLLSLNFSTYKTFLSLSAASFFFVIVTNLNLFKYIKFKNDFFIFFILYCIFYSTIPFIHHRYFFPLYALISANFIYIDILKRRNLIDKIL